MHERMLPEDSSAQIKEALGSQTVVLGTFHNTVLAAILITICTNRVIVLHIGVLGLSEMDSGKSTKNIQLPMEKVLHEPHLIKPQILNLFGPSEYREFWRTSPMNRTLDPGMFPKPLRLVGA